MTFKEEYYSNLYNDYISRPRQSFLLEYLKNEKENNIKLRLKTAYYRCIDNMGSEKRLSEYMDVVLEALIEDNRLKNRYYELQTIPILLRHVCNEEDMVAYLEQVENKQNKNQIGITKWVKKQLLDMKTGLVKSWNNSDVALHIDMIEEELVSAFSNAERNNPYILLCENYLDYAHNQMDEKEYVLFMLNQLTGKYKVYLSQADKNSVGTCLWNYTNDTIQKLLDSNLITDDKKAELTVIKDNIRFEKINDKKKINLLYDILANYQVELPSKNLVRDVTEEIKMSMLEKEATDYLYEIGYGENGKIEGQAKRVQNHSLDMLGSFFMKKHLSPFSVSKTEHNPNEREERAKACKNAKLYLEYFANNNKYDSDTTFIPLEVDPTSALGLYLISTYYLDLGSSFDTEMAKGILKSQLKKYKNQKLLGTDKANQFLLELSQSKFCYVILRNKDMYFEDCNGVTFTAAEIENNVYLDYDEAINEYMGNVPNVKLDYCECNGKLDVSIEAPCEFPAEFLPYFDM